jgi:ssDNA-binding replication factor A large subunit
VKNTAEDISKERVINTFKCDLRRRELKEELGCVKPKAIAHLVDIANRWADGKESLHNNRVRSVDDDDADTRYRQIRGAGVLATLIVEGNTITVATRELTTSSW